MSGAVARRVGAAITAPLTETAARTLTDEVKADAAALWQKLLALYEGEAHTALGYSSWGDYYEAEFGQSGDYGYKLLRAAQVAGLTRQMSNGDGPTNEAQARELVPLLDQPEELVQTVAELREQYPEKLTAKVIRDAVRTKLGSKPAKGAKRVNTEKRAAEYVARGLPPALAEIEARIDDSEMRGLWAWWESGHGLLEIADRPDLLKRLAKGDKRRMEDHRAFMGFAQRYPTELDLELAIKTYGAVRLYALGPGPPIEQPGL